MPVGRSTAAGVSDLPDFSLDVDAGNEREPTTVLPLTDGLGVAPVGALPAAGRSPRGIRNFESGTGAKMDVCNAKVAHAFDDPIPGDRVATNRPR